MIHPGDARLLALGCAVGVAARFHPVGGGYGIQFALTVALGIGATSTRGRARMAFAVAALLVWQSFCAQRSLDALSTRSGAAAGTVTLVRDPQESAFGSRVDVRFEGKRMLLQGSGREATQIMRLQAGDRVRIIGRRRASPRAGWRIARHLAGDLSATSVAQPRPGHVLFRVANGLRSLVLRSGRVLPPAERALFSGFVLGDSRMQSELVEDDFRASGLSHLLVVSGQNVAFTVAAAGPILRRLKLPGRTLVLMVILLLFATATRFEPSVLRASAMAAIAGVGVGLGRPQPAVRTLALAVLGLLLVDPLLAWSVGFGLSVCASLGLVLLSEPLSRRLGGGRWHVLSGPLSTTVAAQCGASLVLLPVFGGVPLVAIPANLLALPVAQPIMTWGIAAGLPAGLAASWFGDSPARLVHLPTFVALWWVEHVASLAARIPVGEVGIRAAIVLAALAVAAMVGRRVRAGGAVVAASVLIAPILAAAPTRLCGASVCFSGITGRLDRRADVVVLGPGARLSDVLLVARRGRLQAVDLVVVKAGGRRQGVLLDSLVHRLDVGAVLASDRVMAGHVRPFIDARVGTRVRLPNSVLTVHARAGKRFDFSIESTPCAAGC